MTIGVYIIQNTANGKFYVGSSLNCEARFIQHRRELRKGCHHSPRLQNSWNKYGESSFAFGVILCCWIGADALRYEQEMLSCHHGTEDCMNAIRQARSPLLKGAVVLPKRTSAEIAAYKQKWAERNRERVRESHRRWSEGNREKLRQWGVRYRTESVEASRASKRAWEERNRERVLEIRRAYRKRKRAELRAMKLLANQQAMSPGIS